MEKKYLTTEEFDELLKILINAQDRALITLLREGAKGEDNEELINLRKSDIDYKNNILTLTRNNGDMRKIEVSSRTIEILDETIYEKEYYKNNGELDGFFRSPKFYLANTEYILRPAGRSRTGKIKSQNVHRRLKIIGSIIDNRFLTPTTVWYSGIIEYAKRYKKENNKDELSTDDYKAINRRFGQDEQYWHQSKTIIKDFL